MANTPAHEFHHGYGDKNYQHAKNNPKGDWTPNDVHELRKEEYEKRLNVFKEKVGLQTADQLQHVGETYTFQAGDTLYPALKDFYGMNNHSAFLVMSKMLARGINVDLIEPGDKITLNTDGADANKTYGMLKIEREGQTDEVIEEVLKASHPEAAAEEERGEGNAGGATEDATDGTADSEVDADGSTDSATDASDTKERKAPKRDPSAIPQGAEGKKGDTEEKADKTAKKDETADSTTDSVTDQSGPNPEKDKVFQMNLPAGTELVPDAETDFQEFKQKAKKICENAGIFGDLVIAKPKGESYNPKNMQSYLDSLQAGLAIVNRQAFKTELRNIHAFTWVYTERTVNIADRIAAHLNQDVCIKETAKAIGLEFGVNLTIGEDDLLKVRKSFGKIYKAFELVGKEYMKMGSDFTFVIAEQGIWRELLSYDKGVLDKNILIDYEENAEDIAASIRKSLKELGKEQPNPVFDAQQMKDSLLNNNLPLNRRLHGDFIINIGPDTNSLIVSGRNEEWKVWSADGKFYWQKIKPTQFPHNQFEDWASCRKSFLRY